MPVCRECIQPIIWLTTNAGKKMPVNMTPVGIVVGEGLETMGGYVRRTARYAIKAYCSAGEPKEGVND